MKSKTRKLLTICFALIILAFVFGRIYYWLTDDFTLSNLTTQFPSQEKFYTPPPEPLKLQTINEILHQKYTYLGKGAQTYAFASEDGNYVLKLVKQKHYKLSLIEEWLLSIPFLKTFKDQRLTKKRTRFEKFLASCLLCYQELQEETALLYVHLTKTDYLQSKAQIIDKIGFSHEIDLDKTQFILQKKAEPLTSRIERLAKKNDFLAIHESIQKIVDLLKDTWQKGIADQDIQFINNVGFIGQKAMFIDTGEFVKNSSFKNQEVYQRDIAIRQKLLMEWLSQNYPEVGS